jgi:signal transduction histidine kinase
LVTHKILLSQVFANLIGNAIKHHDGESGKIQISAQLEDKLCRFTISDDGPGIPKQYQEKIFGIFQTLDEGHSSENTGIGLALTKKIVTEMGGEIWVENLEPRGCQFCFTWAR